MSEVEVTKIILKMAAKSCESDVIPISLLKSILPSIITCIARIMNISLMQGIFASNWKTAIMHPLLKTLWMELILSNFRPVSNLPFLSKVMEKCALTNLEDHEDASHLLLLLIYQLHLVRSIIQYCFMC